MRQSTSDLAQADRRALERLKSEINAPNERTGDEPHSEKRDSQRRSRLRSPWTWGIVACGLLALVLLTAGVLFYLSTPPDRSSPRATVTGYFSAVQAQNYDLAWQYSAAIYTDATSQSRFIASLRSDDAQLGRVVKVDVDRMNIVRDNSGSATVQINVYRADSANSVTYTLIVGLYNGSLWLISNISTS
jgi:hypothetical protein